MSSSSANYKVVSTSKSEKNKLTQEVCFYYSEKDISASFMVDPDDNVMQALPFLFGQFLKGNNILSNLVSESQLKFPEIMMAPNVRSEDCTFDYWRRLCAGGKPLVLVTGGGDSPLVAKVLRAAESSALGTLSQKNTPTVNDINDSSEEKEQEDNQLKGRVNELEIQNQSLNGRIVVIESRIVELQSENQQLNDRFCKLEVENIDLKQTIGSLQSNSQILMAKSQKLARRSLLNVTRAKMAVDLNSQVPLPHDLLEEAKNRFSENLTSKSIEMLFTSSSVRRMGNEVVHTETSDTIAEGVISMPFGEDRDCLRELFLYAFQANVDDVFYSTSIL